MRMIIHLLLISILLACSDEAIFVLPKDEILLIEENDPIPDFNCNAKNFGTQLEDGYFFPPIYRKAYWAKGIGLVSLEELDNNYQSKRILLKLKNYMIN